MPTLLTNESSILTHILSVRLISSKLHTVKSHIHYEFHYYNIDLNKSWGWKQYAMMVWMYSETSSHCGQRNDACLLAGPGNWGAPMIEWLRLDSFAGDSKLALRWQLITIFEVVFSSLEHSRVTLFKLLSRWKSVHIIYFQIRVLVAQTYI